MELIIKRALEAAKLALDSLEDKGRELGAGAFGDISTVADVTSEKAIIDVLKDAIPGITILSEEAGLLGDPDNSEYLAIVDPVDGTVNLKQDLPFYSAAVAISKGEKFSDIIAAGIINLVNGEVIIANEKCVYINGKPAKPSNISSLSDAVISFDLKVFKHGEKLSKFAERIASKARYARFMGSAALETAYVGCGRLDCFLALNGVRVVDMAAAAYIVTRSGGAVKCLDGSLENLNLLYTGDVKYVAAANDKLLKELIEIFSEP
ncbi:MAG: inositol monophosphatase [Thaumarchaeota archaeon]|nr:inositol monophosphatase [Candidatus Terraquivivens yellowstonensis]